MTALTYILILGAVVVFFSSFAAVAPRLGRKICNWGYNKIGAGDDR